jgi:hypothetical protein
MKDALKLALEALDAWLPTVPNLIEKKKAAITAIKQALAAQQEHEPENEPHVSLASVQERTDYAVHLNHCNIGECEGVCKYLDDDCPALKHADMKAKWDKTTPPAAQRQWVGLTEDESDEIFNNWPTYNLDHFEFAQVAVAKVFEKNLTTKVTVPDALNPKDENPAYAAGWNDCRAEMLKGNTP